MGTDINAAIEFKGQSGKWKAVLLPNPWHGSKLTARQSINRNYNLFAILGNVRNDSWFAGISAETGFVPMSDNRGIPEDVSEETQAILSGDHSATFVTLEEVLKYGWTRTTKHRGWVNGPRLEEYNQLKSWKKWPTGWSRDVSGPNVKHVSLQELEDEIAKIIDGEADYCIGVEKVKETLSNTYCLLEWETNYAECAKQFWETIFPVMLKFGNQYGYENVRLVMDFDS